jgi:hypothetical protein
MESVLSKNRMVFWKICTMQQLTTASLLQFVRELNKESLEPLIQELEKNPKQFSCYFKLAKQDWEKYYGPSGIHIYNELHIQESISNYCLY